MSKTLHFLLVLGIISISACSTCPPCVPTHEVVDNPIPVYSCPEPPVIEPVVIQPKPEPPGGEVPDEMKGWYVGMVTWVKSTISYLLSEIEFRDEIIEAYRTKPK